MSKKFCERVTHPVLRGVVDGDLGPALAGHALHHLVLLQLVRSEHQLVMLRNKMQRLKS